MGGKPVLKHALKKGKGKEDGKGKGEGKGKGKKERGPSGPDLDRERITIEPVIGEVKVWKERTDKFGYGFIKPADVVEHEDATKRDGLIYINKKDVAEGVEMAVGLQVCFHIFHDASGLGAEEC